MWSRITVRRAAGLISLSSLVLLAACGSQAATTESPAVTLSIAAVAAVDSQVAVVGTTLPDSLAVRVVDQDGTAVPGATVTWTVLSGAGSVSSSASATDASGRAAITWTLGTSSGTQQLIAALADGKADTITAIARAGAVRALAVASDPFVQVAAGTVTPPIQVRAFDQYGNGVAHAVVTWTTTAGALSADTAITSANGVAQTALLTSSSPQDHVVRATLGGYTATVTVRGQ